MLDDVIITKKNIKNINIRIKPSGVHVSAPLFTSSKTIDAILKKKISWIIKKQEALKNKYQSKQGIYFYLGKEHNVQCVIAEEESLHVKDDMIVISHPTTLEEFQIKAILDAWYKKEARNFFKILVEKYEPLVGKKVARIKVQKMKTRWGSCNYHKRYINLNLHLIKTPIQSIEYVVLHELAHLIYPNHSKDFYDFIEHHMSDYKKRKKALEKFQFLE